MQDSRLSSSETTYTIHKYITQWSINYICLNKLQSVHNVHYTRAEI